MRSYVRTLVTVASLLSTPVAALAQNGIVELPAVFIDTTYPSQPGATRTVCASGCTHATLQAAIDNAAPGDTITLAPGSVHSGTITLRAKTNPNNLWIVIRSSSAAFNPDGALAPGTRVGPGNAGSMAAIEAPHNASAIVTAADANRYRLVGLEVRPAPSATEVTNLIRLGSDTSSTTAARHITIDRCWVHGRATGGWRRGAALNGEHMAVIDSYFSEFHLAGGESQALASWNGWGPFKIVNNYLEAASENVMFGGDDPGINGLISSDIEVRRNHMAKPLAWRGTWVVKNLFELKNARRLLVEGNVFENVWAGGQSGAGIVLKTVNPSGGCTWCSTIDLTFRYNIVRHAAMGMEIVRNPGGGPADQLGDFLIEHNLFEHIDHDEFGGSGATKFILITDESGNLIFRHNTFLNDNGDNGTNGGTFVAFSSNSTVNGFVFSHNLGRKNQYGIRRDGMTDGIVSIEASVTGNITFERNGIAGCTLSQYDSATYDNQCPTYATWEAQFVDYSEDGDGGDYHLVCESDDSGCTPNIYRAAWNEDIGADIDVIHHAISGCPDCGGGGGGEQAPYNGAPLPVPGTFEAEHFDLGGEGVAYHDAVQGNAGGAFRTSEDVDIIGATGNGTGYVVNNFATGEWLEYTINVAAGGAHTIELHVSSEFTTSRFHVEVDGVNLTGSVAVPDTGWWGTFQWIIFSGVNLSSGQHVLRVVADQQYFNFDAVRITRQAPFGTTPAAAPGTFQAEDFDRGGEGVAYHDAVPGNAGGLYRTSEDVDIILPTGNNTGHVVNNFQTGEWMEYTIDVATAGTYVVQLKLSSTYTTSSFRLEVDGVDVSGSVPVPSTGAWNTFQFVSAGSVTLSAGHHVVRVFAEQEYFNLDAIQIQ